MEQVRIVPGLIPHAPPHLLGSCSGTNHILALSKYLNCIVSVEFDFWWARVIAAQQYKEANSRFVSHLDDPEQFLSWDEGSACSESIVAPFETVVKDTIPPGEFAACGTLSELAFRLARDDILAFALVEDLSQPVLVELALRSHVVSLLRLPSLKMPSSPAFPLVDVASAVTSYPTARDLH